MSFVRQVSNRWHQEVPGSRWFRADLHTHTIDDHPGGRAKMPTGVSGDPTDPGVLRKYAKAFLQAAARVGVQVLGLTPHSTKTGDGSETSAVWQIVDVWNNDHDDDGQPFRDKLYAVFPGFEPNVNDGGSGVHLIFLFDPEIGKSGYLSLFEAVMNGRTPWDGCSLMLTSRNAREICETIDDRQKESRSTDRPWDYLILAPHFQNRHGILGEMKSQVLETFPCHRFAGYELGDDKLPDDFNVTEKPGRFLLPFMKEHRQAFFHSSDGYSVGTEGEPSENQVGYRTTWIKLATPRIEGLRQAFIASESRLRIAFQRDESGCLRSLPEPPDPLQGKRPWLRRVTVRGEAAFFGGRRKDQLRKDWIELSPDLTCIIGGSMTGKSTLLDGLRVHSGAEMPVNERLLKDVEARGRQRFLAGSAEIALDTPGQPTGLPIERWPAVFFTQNELQYLAQDPGAIQDLLTRLVPDEQTLILERDKRLAELDKALSKQARHIGGLLDQRAEAEQQLAAARDSRKALEAFEQAGLGEMHATERLHGYLERGKERAAEVHQQIDGVASALDDGKIESGVEREILECMKRKEAPLSTLGLVELHTRAVKLVKDAGGAVRGWAAELERVQSNIQTVMVADREGVERKLAELGLGAEKLAEFKTLSGRAGTLASCEAIYDEVVSELQAVQETFERDRVERERLIAEQRDAFDRVREKVETQFAARIRVRRVDHGISRDLGALLLSFNQKGITRWWNALDGARRPSPRRIYEALQQQRLGELGVSDTVAERFREAFTEAKRYELDALRSPDRYLLELRVGDEDYREVDRLSGGRRVSLLLSLLLEAHDERPLVIDQPEDELDNRFLLETVLPALRRLKGRRQVVVATHDANIVVNGDADLVVRLEADSEHGRVTDSGAIEDPRVRTAILETVDGGERAFELRKAKYGF